MTAERALKEATEADAAEKVRAGLRAMIDGRGWSIADVARQIGRSDSALSTWLRGQYRGDNARITQLVQRWLDTEREVESLRAAGLERHADLAVTERVARVAQHAHANADLVVVYGAAGAGKTWALRRYVADHTGAWFVSASPAITTPSALLARVARALDVAGARTTAAQYERGIVDRLSIGPALLVVDEAHHLSQPLLDVLRCVHDAAACGLVLAGNEPLWGRLAGGDRAAQLVSRVGIACRLRRPAEADVVQLAETLVGEQLRGRGRAAVLAAGRGMGGLRAVRKLIGQAHILARGDGRERAAEQDLADAAELLAA